jgi:uncharacterized protein (DUF2141 family)
MRNKTLTLLALLLFAALLPAADLTVQITGVRVPASGSPGEIGCALYSKPDGFPMNNASATVQWHPAKAEGVTCKFPGLASGKYAVSVVHDLNGNKRTDTKMFGIPTEDWGVSNNIRPKMRAPKFEEAAFAVDAAKDVKIEIRVAR